MVLYKVLIMPSARKDFRVIPKIERDRIIKRISSLAVNPRPPGCEKLTGQNRYRIRQGDYRVIYTIRDKELVVWVVKVGHRREIYRVSEEKEKFKAVNTKRKKG